MLAAGATVAIQTVQLWMDQPTNASGWPGPANPAVTLLDASSIDTRQRHFDDVVCVTGALGRPVAERRSELMDGDVQPPHAPQEIAHRRAGDRGAPALAGEHEIRLARQRSQDRDCAVGERHTVLVGTSFMRSAGTVHSIRSRSISDQRAWITSPVRAAVSTRNSRARAPIPSRAASCTMKPGTSANGSAR